jgi:hypothetical protein
MLSLFWQLCTVVGLVSIVGSTALVTVCTWSFVLEPRLAARRQRRMTVHVLLREPPQRPYRTPRAVRS